MHTKAIHKKCRTCKKIKPIIQKIHSATKCFEKTKNQNNIEVKHLDLSGIENAYNDNTMLKFLYESYTIEVKKMQKTGREMKTYEVLCVCSYGGK